MPARIEIEREEYEVFVCLFLQSFIFNLLGWVFFYFWLVFTWPTELITMIHYAFYKEEGVFSSTYVLAVASIWNKEISKLMLEACQVRGWGANCVKCCFSSKWLLCTLIPNSEVNLIWGSFCLPEFKFSSEFMKRRS